MIQFTVAKAKFVLSLLDIFFGQFLSISTSKTNLTSSQNYIKERKNELCFCNYDLDPIKTSNFPPDEEMDIVTIVTTRVVVSVSWCRRVLAGVVVVQRNGRH